MKSSRDLARRTVTVLVFAAALSSCKPQVTIPDDLSGATWEVINLGSVEDLPEEVLLLESVFWEPQDTISLRRLIRETPLVRDKTVLEIGTGSGLISLCALQYGAAKAVATDVNPAAVANAQHNAERMGLADRLEVRRVPLEDRGAFTVIAPDEKFDLIISNPPWVDKAPSAVDEFALYDEDFYLLNSLIEGMRSRLNPGGKGLFAYGTVTGIRTLIAQAQHNGMETDILDDRNLDELTEEFLPGMLIEIRP